MSEITRNGKVLESFVAYCRANPSLRFWQALRSWSGQEFILASTQPPGEIEMALGAPSGLHDTFHWEGQDG